MTMNRALDRARRRPVVFMLVYGAFLVLIGITATAQAVMTSSHIRESVLSSVATADRAVIGTFVEAYLEERDLNPDQAPASRYELLHAKLNGVLASSDFEHSSLLVVEVVDPQRRVLFSSGADRRGAEVPSDPWLDRALDGQADARLGEAVAGDWTTGATDQAVIREWLPLRTVGEDGDVTTVGAVLVARDAVPIVARLNAAQLDVVLTTISASVVVAILLFFIFRGAQGRISRQTAALVEAARNDQVTGLFNHGTVVEGLSDALDAARDGEGLVAVALLDLDNFTLTNEVHGHPAGDEVLRRMGENLRAAIEDPWFVGRFGPDEFLVVAPGASTSRLEGTLARFRRTMADDSVQFGESEKLPVTFSAGIAAFPEQAANVTELLSSATLTLGEARSSGGDAIRVADRTADERADARGFDVLHGLVIAVDNKDRYTKRHSEDVARYATFIARRLGLDEEFQSTIRLAGLLHDVGKIGIPDGVLRKPGRLTEPEAEIVKQHVALGDAIVRDLPNIEVVRAGIRHHHERWDGGGYLHGLASDEIPLIARILSVADVFSAMTTTRPYRKALPLTEALKRLGDAADTQLDEKLVKLFIEGIETAPDAPLPGQEVPAGQLWIPPPRTAPQPA
ncbi:MAG: diguanylate cyclase [Chloroflexi bacterium]|nr:diguanylate cyclase [Chloroflexota bacterium]